MKIAQNNNVLARLRTRWFGIFQCITARNSDRARPILETYTSLTSIKFIGAVEIRPSGDAENEGQASVERVRVTLRIIRYMKT